MSSKNDKKINESEILISNKIVQTNDEIKNQILRKEKRSELLILTVEKLTHINQEIEGITSQLLNANKELILQNEEKENRAAELFIANQELAYQNEEKAKRAAELVIANEELAYQNEEKAKRAAELVIANKELAYQNEEKAKRNDELIIANKELIFQNKEKEKRAEELIEANLNLTRTNQEVEHLANHDYLTNLFSRRYFYQSFQQLNKLDNYPLGIMMLDINGLKIINDAFGQKSGDLVVIKIAEAIKNSFTEKAVISRIGGDEFSILLPKTTRTEMQTIKRHIFNKVTALKLYNVELSIAAGFEILVDDSNNFDEIMHIVENNMYSHKTTVASSARSKAISAILKTLTDKFEIEKKHSERVSSLCGKIGKAMNMTSDDIKGLEHAGMYHDIGKISIPDRILQKPDKLKPKEFEIIKTHTEIGYQILRAADEYSNLAIHARHHHERWDGKGYPNGLKEIEIPLVSRIIGVVDAYEAMTSDRPYRQKLSEATAVKELTRYSGTQFDPSIARIFVEKVLHQTWRDIDLKIG